MRRNYICETPLINYIWWPFKWWQCWKPPWPLRLFWFLSVIQVARLTEMSQWNWGHLVVLKYWKFWWLSVALKDKDIVKVKIFSGFSTELCQIAIFHSLLLSEDLQGQDTCKRGQQCMMQAKQYEVKWCKTVLLEFTSQYSCSHFCR